MFIYFEKERASRGGADREGERELQAGSMLLAQSPKRGSNTNYEIMIYAKTKGRMLN